MILTRTGVINEKGSFLLNLLVLGKKKPLTDKDKKMVKDILNEVLFFKDKVEGLCYLEGMKNGEGIRLERSKGESKVLYKDQVVLEGEKAEKFIADEFPFDEKEFNEFFITEDDAIAFDWLRQKEVLPEKIGRFLSIEKALSSLLKNLYGLLGRNPEVPKLERAFKKDDDSTLVSSLKDLYFDSDAKLGETIKAIGQIKQNIFLMEEDERNKAQIKKITAEILIMDDQIKKLEAGYKSMVKEAEGLSKSLHEVQDGTSGIKALKARLPFYEKLDEEEKELDTTLGDIQQLRDRLKAINREKKSLLNVVSPNQKIIGSYDRENDEAILDLEEKLGIANKLREDIEMVRTLLVHVDNLAEAVEEDEARYEKAKEEKEDKERLEALKILWRNDEKERKEAQEMILSLLSSFNITDFSSVRAALPKIIVQVEKDFHSISEQLSRSIEKRNRKEYAEKVLLYEHLRFSNLTKKGEEAEQWLLSLLGKEKKLRKALGEDASHGFISKQDLTLSIEAKEEKLEEGQERLDVLQQSLSRDRQAIDKLKNERRHLAKLKETILSNAPKHVVDASLPNEKQRLKDTEQEMVLFRELRSLSHLLLDRINERKKIPLEERANLKRIIKKANIDPEKEEEWNQQLRKYLFEKALEDISKHLTHIHREDTRLLFDEGRLYYAKRGQRKLFVDLPPQERLSLFMAIKLRFEKELEKFSSLNRKNYFLVFTSLSHKALNHTLKTLGLREFPLIVLRTTEG